MKAVFIGQSSFIFTEKDLDKAIYVDLCLVLSAQLVLFGCGDPVYSCCIRMRDFVT